MENRQKHVESVTVDATACLLDQQASKQARRQACQWGTLNGNVLNGRRNSGLPAFEPAVICGISW